MFKTTDNPPLIADKLTSPDTDSLLNYNYLNNRTALHGCNAKSNILSGTYKTHI